MYVFIFGVRFCYLPTFIIDKKNALTGNLGSPVVSHTRKYCVCILYNGLTKAQKLLMPFVFSVCCRKLFLGSHSWFSSQLLLSLSLFCTHKMYNFLSPWNMEGILLHIHFSVLWIKVRIKKIQRKFLKNAGLYFCLPPWEHNYLCLFI